MILRMKAWAVVWALAVLVVVPTFAAAVVGKGSAVGREIEDGDVQPAAGPGPLERTLLDEKVEEKKAQVTGSKVEHVTFADLADLNATVVACHWFCLCFLLLTLAASRPHMFLLVETSKCALL